MAIALYEFDAKLAGSPNIAPNKYKIHNFESAGNGLFRKKEAVVEDVFTGQMIRPDQKFRQGDLKALKQNWIISEALTAFQQSGTIPYVPYLEDVSASPPNERRKEIANDSE